MGRQSWSVMHACNAAFIRWLAGTAKARRWDGIGKLRMARRFIKKHLPTGSPFLSLPNPKRKAEAMGKLVAVPVSLDEANAFVRDQHRHHAPVVGHKFSIGAAADGKLVAVAIVGRPVSRHRDDGRTLEVTRLCSDGTRNACSFLYGRAAKAAFALGFSRIGTYIRADEDGASVKAANWRLVGETKGRSWDCQARPRQDRTDIVDRSLFELQRMEVA